MTDNKALIERLRVEADWCDCVEEICPYTAAADHIEKLEADNARLREALGRMIYETTHLSPMKPNGDHDCIIKADALTQARAALQETSNAD